MSKKINWEKELIQSEKDFATTPEQQKVNYIRHWIIQELAYWQDIRLLNTLYRMNMQQFENHTKKEIIYGIGLELAKKHTSKEKRIIITKACNYALKQSKEPIHAWLGD